MRQAAGMGRGDHFPQPPESHVLYQVGGEPEGGLRPPVDFGLLGGVLDLDSVFGVD